MDIIKKKFTKKLKTLSANANSAVMSTTNYNALLDQVQFLKILGLRRSKDFDALNNYDVIQVQGDDKLIYPNTEHGVKFYVTEEDLFEILYNTHCSIGHGDPERMVSELNKRYKNITWKQISLFLQCCEICEQKKGNKQKRIIEKPIVIDQLKNRCQLDFIDLQSQPDDRYKFVFVYHNYLTKFVVLRSLTSKHPLEVVYHLLDIFTTLGAPCVLESNHGREFCDSVINILKDLWPGLYIVHGQARCIQDIESIERVNRNIVELLFTWMNDNKTTNWSEGLRFVQFMKNTTYQCEIKTSPYKATFRCLPEFGISNCGLPESILVSLTTEEELKDSMKHFIELKSPNTGEVSSTSNNFDIKSA